MMNELGGGGAWYNQRARHLQNQADAARRSARAWRITAICCVSVVAAAAVAAILFG